MAGRPQVSVSPGERRGRRRARGKERLDPSRRIPEGPRTRRRAPPSDLRRDRPELWQDRAGPEVPPGGHGLFRRRHPGRAGERVREIAARREAGDKLVGTFCIYVPEEIILALGAIPVALCGGTSASIPYAEKMLPRDICPLVKSTLGLALSNACPYGPIEDLAVGETTCDAKRPGTSCRRAGISMSSRCRRRRAPAIGTSGTRRSDSSRSGSRG